MPDDLEALRKRIEEGVEAAEQMQRILQQQERAARGEQKKRFRLIKGGAIGAAVSAGVEWLWGYKVAVAVATAAVAFTGGVIADQPGSPSADPPQVVKPPATIRPPVPPRPKATPTPLRTSPPRTQVPMRIIPPSAPATTRPTVKPTVKPKEKPAVRPTPSQLPAAPSLGETNPTVSLPVTPTVTPSVPVVSTPPPCTVNLLGIKLCLPLGGS
jgi:hypothetical protein